MPFERSSGHYTNFFRKYIGEQRTTSSFSSNSINIGGIVRDMNKGCMRYEADISRGIEAFLASSWTSSWTIASL